MYSAESVEEFLEYIFRDSNRNSNGMIRLYRGQSKNRPLLPTLFRGSNDHHKVLKVERELLSAFKNECPYLLPSRPDNDWDWLSIGQHFGLPTRLLDWSGNPLAALFFAVEKNNPESPRVLIYYAQAEHVIKEEDKNGASSPFTIARTKILQPTRHSLRVAMQSGWHTVHTTYKNGFIPLDTMKVHRGHMSIIEIKAQSADAIRDDLGKMGITHATVYGDLGSVSRALKDKCGLVFDD